MTTQRPGIEAAAPMPGRGPHTEFGSAQVYAIAGCYFVASFAALGLPPYLTVILPELGDPGARGAGLLYVVPTLFGALGAPVWGRLADRFGHKPLLLRAQLGLAVSFLLAGAASSLPLFAAALALQGLLGGTYAASSGYLAAALKSGSETSRALTLMQASARAALVTAPIMVGLLTPWLSPQRQYLVMAALPLAAAFLLTALPTPRRHRPTTGVSAGQPLTPVPMRPPHLLYALEFFFVLSTVVSFPYLIALVEYRDLGIPVALSGFLFAVPHLCYLAAAIPVHRLVSARPLQGLALGFLLVAVGLAGHAVVHTAAVFASVRVLLGAGLVLGLVSLAVLTAEAAAHRRPGAMFGWLELFSKGGAVVSGLVATATNALWGPEAPMLAGTATALVAVLVIASPVLKPSLVPCTPTRRSHP